MPADAEQRLGDFAELVALALASAEAREQLAASRARIVEASHAERRRLERDLHDGAQQRLVGVSLTLRVAQSRLHVDPTLAESLLEDARVALGQALEELRELAQGHPPGRPQRAGVAARPGGAGGPGLAARYGVGRAPRAAARDNRGRRVLRRGRGA